MASTQEQQVVLNDEAKAVLEVAKKEVDGSMEQVSKPNHSQEHARVYGAIGNATTHKLKLDSVYKCSGHFQSYNIEIMPGKVAMFVADGTPPEGSKVGVKYVANGHQWILVWSVPLQIPGTFPSFNRVYVEDGPVCETDWDEIEKKLGPSPAKSPGAYAEITQGSVAKLSAVFSTPVPRPPTN